MVLTHHLLTVGDILLHWPPMTESSEPLTLQQAADYLKVKKRTLYSWVRAGTVPFERAGRGIRFRQERLDAWMAETAHFPRTQGA